MADAAHRIGHAIAAIGAYKNVRHELPTSLDAAYAIAGIGPDFQTRYVDQVPTYQRMDAGAPDETNTYAFTLTIWGDGGRCEKGGGVSWLLVRNQAFGESPLRCWKWKVLNSDTRAGLGSKKANRWSATLETAPSVLPADGAKQAVLGVPATLLGSDAAKIEEAEKALRGFGWQEVPIPPRIMVGK